MARKPISGVSGVLGELISQPRPEPSAPTAPRTIRLKTPRIAAAKEKPPASTKSRARLGRPPGRQSTAMTPKEKITVRIDARLVALYRDWSWERRCQLGELVERALRDYRRRQVR